jgi:hypothetical protein
MRVFMEPSVYRRAEAILLVFLAGVTENRLVTLWLKYFDVRKGRTKHIRLNILLWMCRHEGTILQ